MVYVINPCCPVNIFVKAETVHSLGIPIVFLINKPYFSEFFIYIENLSVKKNRNHN